MEYLIVAIAVLASLAYMVKTMVTRAKGDQCSCGCCQTKLKKVKRKSS